MFAEEPRPAYDRVALTSYVDTWDPMALQLDGATYDGDDLVTLHLGDPVIAIDRTARKIHDARPGRPWSTTRSCSPPARTRSCRRCPATTCPAATCTGPSRTSTRSAVPTPRSPGAVAASALVVGGGLLGLEAAKALRDMGLSPHVVELAPRLMPLQVDEGGGGLLRKLIEKLDVTVHPGTGTQSIEEDRGRLLAKLGNGTELDVDLVVFSAGVRPRDELARASPGSRSASAAASPSARTVVTSDPNIYAIGECACVERHRVRAGRAGQRDGGGGRRPAARRGVDVRAR